MSGTTAHPHHHLHPMNHLVLNLNISLKTYSMLKGISVEKI
jgi:hypothetical protein